MIKSISRVRAVFLASAAAALWTVSGVANAAVTFDISQVGSDVVATASGTFDRTAANPFGENGTFVRGVSGGLGFLNVGTSETAERYFLTNVGPEAFGASTSIIRSLSQTGLNIGFNRTFGYFFIAQSYVNNAAISGTSTFLNSTIGSLGLNTGIYLSSAGGNVITVNIGQASGAVPEPATWAMLTLGFGATGFAMRRKKVGTRNRFA